MRPAVVMNMSVSVPVEHAATDLPVDPLGELESALARTPPSESLAPDVLARFHRLCGELQLAEQISLDESLLRHDTAHQPVASALVIVELVMAMANFALATELAEALYKRLPMDHRVQDTLTRARYYQQTGRVHERPGRELEGLVCPMLWNTVHLLPSGHVHQCCSVWLRRPVGNVFKASLQDIWNSREVSQVREFALQGDYRYCGKVSCPQIQRALFDDNEVNKAFWLHEAPPPPEAPKRFNLSYDLSCNLSCPSCRSRPIVAKGPDLDRIETVTNSVLEMLKQGERVEVTGSGDPFASKSFRRLLTSLNRDEFPRLGITLMTNGQLMQRREWTRFQHLHGMIDAVNVSVDAAEPGTYRQLRRGGELADLLPNLEFIGELRASGAISQFRMCFVVQQLNYREMPDFVALAGRVGADQVHFQMLHDWGSMPAPELARMRVHLSDHPEFQAFVGVLHGLPQAARPQIISDFSYLL
ncbi:hypothetical protein CLD22_10585 [Rubrivivax gelatinosus]|nr:hypothetical protein [Rubrivivax gelatinosus]